MAGRVCSWRWLVADAGVSDGEWRAESKPRIDCKRSGLTGSWLAHTGGWENKDNV